jgi:cell division protein FtsL
VGKLGLSRRLLAFSQGDPSAASRRSRIIRLYLTAMILLSLMFTLYIWQSTKIVEIKIHLKELMAKSESLETNCAVLRADVSRLQALSRIEAVAKNELGMVVPKKMCYIPVPREFWK